ncbi:MAG: 30S ribosomal protein S15 [Candidatus Micrarchaeota archaeon]|nr:30S ribosomal protein S15 [Candidatus Micrarchaeota archaeon]
MAKMHSKKKGKSGSRRPISKVVPAWVTISHAEVEELVLRLSKEGLSSAAIGQRLRDTYGVPSVRNITGKTIVTILEEGGRKPEYPEGLMDLIRRAMRMRKHMEKNHADVHNKTKLIHIESKIKRLVRYHSRVGNLPKGWKYKPETAALLVK